MERYRNSIIDIEDARLNQWMVVWDYFGDSGQFSTFINLYPEFNPAPVRGSPFFFEPAFNITDYDRDGWIDLWTFDYPLDAGDAARLSARLRTVAPLLQQAQSNLVGNARDLWIGGIRSMQGQVSTLETLAEFVQGPCDENQRLLARESRWPWW